MTDREKHSSEGNNSHDEGDLFADPDAHLSLEEKEEVVSFRCPRLSLIDPPRPECRANTVPPSGPQTRLETRCHAHSLGTLRLLVSSGSCCTSPDPDPVHQLCFLYLLAFLDRTNIGNAKLAGLGPDLGLTTASYNATLTIFFVSYAVFEPVTNILLKRLRPSYFIPITM